MDQIYPYEIREFFRLLGRLWLERIDAELWKFAQALDGWLYDLAAHPTPHWRKNFEAFLAEQRTAGRELTPESRAELLAYLETWPGQAAEQSEAATERQAVHQPSSPGTTPPRKHGRFANRKTYRRMSDDEALFNRKLTEAKRCLDDLEKVLAALADKVDAADEGAEIEVEPVVDEVDDLIWRHNDALESAREAWLRGDLGGNTFDQLMRMPTPVSLWLPMFTDESQAKRAQAQWKKIGKRLNERITFLDNVIFAMQVTEMAGTAASYALTGGVLISAFKQGGKILLVKTVAKMAVGGAVSYGVGKAVEAGLRAAGVSEETISAVQKSAEIVTWLLTLRKIHNSLPQSAEALAKAAKRKIATRTPASPKESLPRAVQPKPVTGPLKNPSGDPEIAAAKARTYPYPARPVRPLQKKTYPPRPPRKKTHPPIEGTVDRPRTEHHTFLQKAIAEEMQSTGDYTKVTMRMKLSKISGVKHNPDIEPDNIGVHADGRIDIFEILSPGQKRTKLEEKLLHALSEMPPAIRGGFRIVDPKDAFQ